MNTRAITLIATIAVIGIVAVGAGYAYTAITVNDSNNAEAKYVTLTQSAYTFTATSVDEYFDSATNSAHAGTQLSPAVYKIADTAQTIGDYTMLVLGQVTINAAASGYKLQANAPALNLGITNDAVNDNFTYGAVLNYYLVQGSTVVAQYTASGWKNMDNEPGDVSIAFTKNSPGAEGAYSGYTGITLKLCYGYLTDDADIVIAGGHYVDAVPADLNNGSIVFSTSVAGSNPA